MAKQKITKVVEELLEKFLVDNGYELYNTEFVKEGRDWFLRVYIDMAEEGLYVGTEDCEKVSRFLSEKLDEADPIEQNYYLEVSSPGLDRELIRDEHFEKYAGSQVEAALYRGIDGTKNVDGVLIGLSDGVITIEDEKGKRWELPQDQVAKIRLAVVF